MSLIFDIRNYGAIGDAKTDCTAALQAAVDAASAQGGGTVLVEHGTFLFYPFRLKSNVRLEVAWDAVMLAGPDPERYFIIPKNPYWNTDLALRNNRRCVIYAEGAEHIAICGQGRFDFNGTSFVNVDPAVQEFHGHWKRKSDTLIPGRALFFVGCRDVRLEDLTLTNPAGWFTWFLDCENVLCRGLTITSSLCMPNSDGLHFGSCRNVRVSDCDIHTGDDCIIIRGMQEQFDSPKPCENVTVSNCILQSSTAAVRIGWTHDFEHRNVTFSNIIIRESRDGFSMIVPPMRFPQPDPPRYDDTPTPYPDVQPFAAENFLITNVNADTHGPILNIALDPLAPVAYVRNIALRDVNAISDVPPRVVATPDQHVSNLEFTNVTLTLRPLPGKPDGANAAMHFQNAENVILNNFRILKSC